ncbi:MAG: ATP-binding cassette domain-containing protein, partial [Fusobacterium periodonticum]|nr:ATP-binding cassette domain-containing protein [Fusobacterium periodonticum]
METIIEVKNLKKNYGDREILKDISFSIEKGEIISIIGESGAGKSTLMRCINGLEGINSGSIKFYDTDITKLKEKERNSIKKQMAYVFQDLNII